MYANASYVKTINILENRNYTTDVRVIDSDNVSRLVHNIASQEIQFYIYRNNIPNGISPHYKGNHIYSDLYGYRYIDGISVQFYWRDQHERAIGLRNTEISFDNLWHMVDSTSLSVPDDWEFLI